MIPLSLGRSGSVKRRTRKTQKLHERHGKENGFSVTSVLNKSKHAKVYAENQVPILLITHKPVIGRLTQGGFADPTFQFLPDGQFNPDFPLGRRMSASGFSRQFCANFEGNSY
jgi:hypothetical protein